jgi:hypothetical protein
MAACLFSVSFAAALFTLAVLKLLSFFIMPSLFFDLLFIGFPLGAWLGARFIAPRPQSFVRSLWALTAIMALSIAGSLLAKRFDYLRASLFQVELPRLIGQVAVFVAMFLPFFAAYGLCEYLGYQVGRRRLGGRMTQVYATALFGAAAAYLAMKMLLPPLGMARILVAAFIALAMAILAIGGPAARWAAAIELAGLLALSAWPDLERRFLDFYKGRGSQSTWDFQVNWGCRTVFQKWGRYSLCEILAASDRSIYYGFYNDMFQWEYAPRMGFSGASLGAVPILLTRPGQRLAIVGAGGGRQVRLAEKLGGRSIVAIELEPAVLEAVRRPQYLFHAFGRVYEMPGVTPVQAEARTYFERSSELFDLIYLPSVGGYAQMMIEPGNMIRTLEAYRILREHLTDHGVLAIWYPSGLDAQGILTDQYVQTLRSLGLMTAAYRNDSEFLILAFRDAASKIPSEGRLEGLLTADDHSFAGSPEFSPRRPRNYPVADDPHFVPVTDDRPFLGGNVRYILSMGQIWKLFLTGAAVLLTAAAAIGWSLIRRGDPGIPGRPTSAVALLAVLIGANFLMMEHALVLILFRRIYVYADAVDIGAIGFLLLSGVGSLLGGMRIRPLFLASGVVAAVALIAAMPQYLLAATLAVVPIAVASGMFFPALFDRAAKQPLTVFAYDAVGSGWGALLSTFIPIIWGIQAFIMMSAMAFLATLAADIWFHWPFSQGEVRSNLQDRYPT